MKTCLKTISQKGRIWKKLIGESEEKITGMTPKPKKGTKDQNQEFALGTQG